MLILRCPACDMLLTPETDWFTEMLRTQLIAPLACPHCKREWVVTMTTVGEAAHFNIERA